MRRTASLRARALDIVKSWIPVSCGVLEFVANKRLDLIDDLLYTTPQSLSGDFFKYSISNGRAFDEYDHWLNLFVFWAGNGDPGCRKCW